MDEDRTGARQGSTQTDDEKETFTLNSNRPVSGAGSGIVAGPDRVRRGPGGRRGGGLGAGTEPAPGVVGRYPRGGPEAEGAVGGGRGGIGRFSWGADAQYADV